MNTSSTSFFRKTLPAFFLLTAALSLAAVANIQGAVTPAFVPMLLTTFTNPTPAASDLFGHSVAAVGTDLVLIGAIGDSAVASYAGAAYLFLPTAHCSPPLPSPHGQHTTLSAIPWRRWGLIGC